MTSFRTNNAVAFTTGQSGSLQNAWGILATTGSTGTLTLQGGNPTMLGSYATMSIADVATGQPFPCFVRNVTVTAGKVYILA